MKKAKSAALCTLILLVMSLCIAACQPTPVTPPVAGKNVDLVKLVVDANKPENKAELDNDNKAIAQQISKLGGRLKMTFEPNERITINVDAEITSRGYGKMPLVRVRPKNFSKEQFEAFAKYLTKGQPLYYMDGDLGLMTKEEIADVLPRLKALAGSDTLAPYEREYMKSQLEQLELDYETAISKADEKLYDGKLSMGTENSGGYSNYLDLKCYMGKENTKWLSFYQSSNNTHTQMIYRNANYSAGYSESEPYEGKDAERINMTYEQAKAKAEEFARAMDGEDTNLKLCRPSICYNNDTYFNYTKETSPQAYSFIFYRCYSGAEIKSVMYLPGQTTQSEFGEQAGEVDFSKQVSPEALLVVIDDEGINQALWLNYTEYIETVADDMPLLDFNTVKGIFESYCKYRFSWAPYDDMQKDMGTTFNVKRVELNLMAIIEKDSLENYITVPVWDFIADQEYEEDYTSQDGYPIEGDKDVSILTINAINGSIINRERGY